MTFQQLFCHSHVQCYTVEPVLNGPVSSGHPLRSSQFSKSCFFAHTNAVFVTCIRQPPLLSSRGHPVAFSSPEAALLLVSTKNRDLWPYPTTEVRNSRTSCRSVHALSQVWQIWLVLVTIYCVYKSIQNWNVVGPGQRSRFLVLTKRSAASGDENDPVAVLFFFFAILPVSATLEWKLRHMSFNAVFYCVWMRAIITVRNDMCKATVSW